LVLRSDAIQSQPWSEPEPEPVLSLVIFYLVSDKLQTSDNCVWRRSKIRKIFAKLGHIIQSVGL